MMKSTPVSQRESASLGAAVSVIIPTHARPERLARLLSSLERQTVANTTVEIIVVDDGSPEGRHPRRDRLPTSVRLVRQPRQGPAAARNSGACEAKGRMLAFIDDDCVAAPGWLAAMLDAHARYPDALLGGLTLNGLPDNLFAEAAESLLGFIAADELRRGRALSFVPSNNLACGRAAFHRGGGFDPSYPLAAGEDRAFCRAWQHRGNPIVRVPEAHVHHCHGHDLASFWRQQYNYGRGAARFHASAVESRVATPARTATARRLRPPREWRFYIRLLLHPLTRRELSPARRFALLPVLLLSQFAIISGVWMEHRASNSGQTTAGSRE